MKIEKMFEMATRNKVRFIHRGIIATEDLWDLSPTELDTIFKGLNSQIKQVKEESLLSYKSKQDEEIELKIELVKYIVSVKLAEIEARSKAKDIKEQKQKILDIMATKKDQSLEEKSVEELELMLKELE